ncbi:replication-relaxation family protein [Corynebacterium variabile]|uniref:replication-relaxation family protein n=1 Tax=Corynebacterium variabile TaxID=1727 RepID=UPI003A9071DD
MTSFETEASLSANRFELLELLRVHRFATSSQLTRFARPRYGSANSARRQTLRHLAALEDDRLVLRLERRVGGWRGGSQVSVWSLTTAGLRTLTGNRRRQRPQAVSTTFLAHTLATTEVCLVLTESVRALDGTRLELVQEPDCWRRFPGTSGEVVTLRPDLAATVTAPDFTDHYFLEVDQATENPARVLTTTRRYLAYRATGREQEAAGVFPALVWIVPNLKRQEQLTRHLQAQPDIPRNLWLVLTLPQLPQLVRDGPEAFADADSQP